MARRHSTISRAQANLKNKAVETAIKPAGPRTRAFENLRANISDRLTINKAALLEGGSKRNNLLQRDIHADFIRSALDDIPGAQELTGAARQADRADKLGNISTGLGATGLAASLLPVSGATLGAASAGVGVASAVVHGAAAKRYSRAAGILATAVEGETQRDATIRKGLAGGAGTRRDEEVGKAFGAVASSAVGTAGLASLTGVAGQATSGPAGFISGEAAGDLTEGGIERITQGNSRNSYATAHDPLLAKAAKRRSEGSTTNPLYGGSNSYDRNDRETGRNAAARPKATARPKVTASQQAAVKKSIIRASIALRKAQASNKAARPSPGTEF